MSDSLQQRHLTAQRFFGGVMMALTFAALVGWQRSPVAAAIANSQRVPILLFGLDAADKSLHTDTLMVTVMDPTRNGLSVVSIPRDTRINLPGYLFNRINEIYGYHLRKKAGPKRSALEVKKGVEYLLSSDDRAVNIPYYFQVDYSVFGKLVDLIGGVWVDIDQPMHYDDKAGNVHIHFEPGRYKLSGVQALRYVRFRGPTGDRGRILRQQEFIRNMAKRSANPTIIFKFPKIVAAVYSSVDTNLSFWDIVYLASAGRRVRFRDIGFYIVPGAPRGPYWRANPGAVRHLVSNLFYGDRSQGEVAETIAPQAGMITVSVWNASGKPGLARTLTKYLRKQGFDVVDWGTYSTEQIPTRVVDRRGDISPAQKVANALGVDNCHSEPNANILVDVEVVIGRDFHGPGLEM